MFENDARRTPKAKAEPAIGELGGTMVRLDQLPRSTQTFFPKGREAYGWMNRSGLLAARSTG